MQSMSRSDYGPKTVARMQPIGSNISQHTNFVMGNDRATLQTTVQQDFSAKPVEKRL